MYLYKSSCSKESYLICGSVVLLLEQTRFYLFLSSIFKFNVFFIPLTPSLYQINLVIFYWHVCLRAMLSERIWGKSESKFQILGVLDMKDPKNEGWFWAQLVIKLLSEERVQILELFIFLYMKAEETLIMSQMNKVPKILKIFSL